MPVPAERTDDIFGSLATVGSVMSIDKGAELYAERAEADSLYQIRTGVLRICKLLPDGRRQIEAFALPGDMIGFEAHGLHANSAEAVTSCSAVRHRRSRVESIAATDSRLARNILDLAVKQLSDAQRHLVRLGRNTAIERLACFILEMMERTNAVKSVDLPMSRMDIADYLGLLRRPCRGCSRCSARTASSRCQG